MLPSFVSLNGTQQYVGLPPILNGAIGIVLSAIFSFFFVNLFSTTKKGKYNIYNFLGAYNPTKYALFLDKILKKKPFDPVLYKKIGQEN
jgi:hypothetical protein